MNPGRAPSTNEYYSLADQLVTFDGTLSHFRYVYLIPNVFLNIFSELNPPSPSVFQISPASPSRKQAVIIHDYTETIDWQIEVQLASITGVKSMFITNNSISDGYRKWARDFEALLTLLVAAQTA
jgi:hypothetical protein